MICLLCAGNSIHFRQTNGCSCESVKAFETENVSTWGGLEPPTFGFIPNALTIWVIRVRHLLSHLVEYWLWRYRYFCSKVNIWYVYCARATAFTFDTRTDVLVKVSKFWDRECLDLRGWGGKVHGVNMGPTWVLSAPRWPHELAIRETM